MHSAEGLGPATRIRIEAEDLFDRICKFFDQRIGALAAGGVARERIILDPGMGLFLGSHPDASFTVLRRIGDFKARFALPLLISVSRKSFLRNLVGRKVPDIGPATLAAELYAIWQGADFLRTHEPAAVRDALAVFRALDGNKA
jgi:dihydropteroate synthase type 2